MINFSSKEDRLDSSIRQLLFSWNLFPFLGSWPSSRHLVFNKGNRIELLIGSSSPAKHLTFLLLETVMMIFLVKNEFVVQGTFNNGIFTRSEQVDKG